MEKVYETPSVKVTVLQSSEPVTASVVGQARHGFFDDDNMRRQTSE